MSAVNASKTKYTVEVTNTASNKKKLTVGNAAGSMTMLLARGHIMRIESGKIDEASKSAMNSALNLAWASEMKKAKLPKVTVL